ncbi:hypothetical protein F5B21DRAFT_439330 [Xylaria acuta]|nr:hypothetical protein F5B21DRAFT_439330 [Xylaria acuta]
MRPLLPAACLLPVCLTKAHTNNSRLTTVDLSQSTTSIRLNVCTTFCTGCLGTRTLPRAAARVRRSTIRSL